VDLLAINVLLYTEVLWRIHFCQGHLVKIFLSLFLLDGVRLVLKVYCLRICVWHVRCVNAWKWNNLASISSCCITCGLLSWKWRNISQTEYSEKGGEGDDFKRRIGPSYRWLLLALFFIITCRIIIVSFSFVSLWVISVCPALLLSPKIFLDIRRMS
jgi:hypothetical protein